jgi:hypothetical protein
MIVGDSVAFFLGQAMQSLRTDPPLAVFNAAIESCTFPPQVTRARYLRTNFEISTFGCDPGWEAGAVARFRPNIVFWITNGAANAVLYRGRWLETCSDQYASLYERSLRSEIALLGAHGAKVAFTTEVYPRYVYASADRPTDCENRLRRNVAAATRVQLIDLQGYICPRGHCRAKQNGVTLRIDRQHYEGAGGRLVAQWLIDQVNPKPSE